MPVILQENGIPLKTIGGVKLKDIPKRELYVFIPSAAMIVKKDKGSFNREFRRGVYNGIRARRHAMGWVFNVHDLVRFMYPYVSEDKIADLMEAKLDELDQKHPGFVRLYLE